MVSLSEVCFINFIEYTDWLDIIPVITFVTLLHGFTPRAGVYFMNVTGRVLCLFIPFNDAAS